MRVLAFYVLAVLLIVCIVPWNDAKLGASPFIAALDRIGIPGAADIMNAVVVTAVLSCLNSGIYVASRMLFALARRGTRRARCSSSTTAASRSRRSCPWSSASCR